MQTVPAPADDPAGYIDRLAHNRRSTWLAALLALAGLFVFVAIFNWFLPSLGSGLGIGGAIALGLLFSLVPAALWLFLFYRLDRVEPEPKRLVLTVFVLSALVTAALHEPLTQGIFQVDRWLYSRWWSQLLGAFFIIAVLEQALIYLVVRFAVVDHPEFNERADGVVYGVAAALGMATVFNFQYVVRRGGVDLDIGSIRMVVNALAYAGFGGVLGYFIAQARFEKTPIYYLPLGFTISALLNSLFFFLIQRTSGSRLTYNPWSDLILAAVVAAVSLAAVFFLIERANEETLRLAAPAPPVAPPPSPPTPPAPATPEGDS